MLSLQDVFSKEEVIKFVEEMTEQLEDPEFVVEYKIDGLSMALRYEFGELKLAETRGDGIQVINGNYGPYIKQNGNNYRIPKGTDAAALTESDCREIIVNTTPTGRKYKKK